MASSTVPHPLALPSTFSPDTLDALTELSLVLAKVRAGIQSSSGITTEPAPGGGAGAPGGPTLSFKEVPGATDGLKHKLQRARAQVRALPDMDRTIGEQTEEIRDLETRIRTQRALLQRLRDEAAGREGKEEAAGGDKMEL
ncbi:RNA polymerase II transcription mediator complex subunit 9-domain-containing protein [Ilyonectria robusta]|uniref:RNA polymerase II transcription mediator complex subunit 9-domain-containing protein n=1 Tax=Ilyonectria robusta TaxID=1079257 RepID=UPI001E8E8FAD|nr:RNA polymerase II transcription mediator complex subunit 9-domain-containing protein [Ilyonectria robusta]KAH8706490.1 RNA polymerase II transcription mediator complex subunit 9-domain-containing protein [Ilyonectria robusta]